MSTNTSASSSSFPKWQLAVLLGTPIALGVGYLYWKNQNSEIKSEDKKKDKLEDEVDSISLKENEKQNQKLVNGTQTKNISPLEQAQSYKNQGNVFFKNGQYDEAIKLYNKAIEVCPTENKIDLSTFYQNRAAAYEALKKWTGVKEDCSKALELNPRYTKALYRRAKACEYLKELENCLEDITATCILESFQNKNSLLFADRVLKELGRVHAKEAMNVRTAVLQSQHFVKSYFASFSRDPLKNMAVESTNAKGFALAKIAFDNQKYDEIIPACTEELELNEHEVKYQTEATLLRGTFYLLCGSYENALTDLNTIINNKELDSKFRVNALIKRASLNMQIEKQDECFNDFNEAESLDSKNPDVYHHRGQVYVLVERLTDALRDFENAVKLAPEQPLPFVHKSYAEYRMAIIHENNLELINAMDNFEQAINKWPECVECYSLMAQVLSEQQQFSQADSFFEKAIKIEPQNATLFVHRGLLQLQWSGNVEKAVQLISTAIDMDDKCEFAYETLGTIEVQRGNLERAIQLFDRALLLAKSEMEMVHIFSLKDAAMAQLNVSKKLEIDLTRLAAMTSAEI